MAWPKSDDIVSLNGAWFAIESIYSESRCLLNLYTLENWNIKDACYGSTYLIVDYLTSPFYFVCLKLFCFFLFVILISLSSMFFYLLIYLFLKNKQFYTIFLIFSLWFDNKKISSLILIFFQFSNNPSLINYSIHCMSFLIWSLPKNMPLGVMSYDVYWFKNL